MRTMTTEQAIMYIRAGYFPKPNETEAICDLQDVFGHLPYRFVLSLLLDWNVCENAERLYRLIWNKEDVDRWVKKVSDLETARKLVDMNYRAYIEAKNELETLEEEFNYSEVDE